jgi:hypothetical protein
MIFNRNDRKVSLYHTEAIDLAEKHKLTAFFGTGHTNQLVVFIHGYGGNAITTWKMFFTLLRSDPFFYDKDIIYYGYKSKEYQAADHAGDFYEFLNDHALSSEETSFCSMALEERNFEKRSYEKVTIVAHSLGAIVTREALKTAFDNKCEWLSKVQMMLFAPAHLGANILPLIFETLDISSVTRLIGLHFKYTTPVLNDLEKGSEILLKIMKETRKLLQEKKGTFTKAKCVVHAKGDRVVQNLKFNEDSDAKRIEGKTHKKVCKPSIEYEEPIEFLKAIL